MSCPAGGIQVRAGIDDNGNGTLEAGEIDSTAFVCGGLNAGRLLTVGTLTANNCVAVEHTPATAGDRGGVAVSNTFFHYRGDGAAARFDITALTNATGIGAIDGLVSDLATRRLYSLASGASTPLDLGVASCTPPTSVDRLVELNPTTGAVIATVTLSTPIGSFGAGCSSNNGIMAGPGFLLVVNPTRVFRIDFTTGEVSDLAARPASFVPAGCENWATWGVAEFDGADYSMVYVRNSTTISRTLISSGVTTSAATFTNLADMCSITVAPNLNRWYWHHEGISQFGSGNQSAGFCDATFSQ